MARYIKFITPAGVEIKHKDDAINIGFDKGTTSLSSDTVQGALLELFNLINSGANITIGDNGNWFINGEDSGHKATGADGKSISSFTLKWGRSNSTTSAPTRWSDTPTLPDANNKYLWIQLGVIYSDNSTSVVIPPAIISVYTSGSGEPTGVSNIEFVTDSATPTDAQDTLYFFLFSLLQGVGLYNNLLNGRDTDLEYKDNVLYSVNSKGYCDIVEPEGNIEIIDNRVWCCGKPTTMWNKGKIVTQTIVYSTTSEYANLAFIVEGPFYSDETRVTVNYDDSLVEIVRYPDSIDYDNNLTVLSDDVVFDNINSGDQIIVDADKFYVPIKLRIKRKNFSASDVVQSFSTTIVLNNGYENTEVKVHFCETVLFYKDGIGYNGFDVDNIVMSRPSKVVNGTTHYSTATNNAEDGYIRLVLNSYCASYMWIYDKNARSDNDEVYIDYSHTVEFYLRILRCSSDTRDMLRLISLSVDPVTTGRVCNPDYFPNNPGDRYFVPIGENGVDKAGNTIHSPNMACLNYLKTWPSIDGAVVGQTFPYSNIAAENCVLENDIGIGEVMYGPLYIAEIGIRKYSNIDLNGWDL